MRISDWSSDVCSSDLALGALALQLAGAANGGGLFAGALFRGLLIVTAQLHLAIHALALQLLLERAQGLVDIVVANDDLHKPVKLQSKTDGSPGNSTLPYGPPAVHRGDLPQVPLPLSGAPPPTTSPKIKK